MAATPFYKKILTPSEEHDAKIIRAKAFELEKAKSSAEYWKQRCLLAEQVGASLNDKVHSVTDFADEITYLERIEAYNAFRQNNEEPKP